MPLRHPVPRFSLAVAAVALTTWANFYIQALASNQVKPLPYFPVLVVVSYYAGLLPAILFVVLATLSLDYWWTEPPGSLWITRSADLWVVVFFLLASGAIIAVSNAARRLVANLRLQEGRLDSAWAAAAESGESLRLALEGARLGMWVRDLATNEIAGTPRYYEILGLPPDSAPLSSERWQQAVHPDDLSRVREVARRAVENRTAYEHQFRVVRRDGSIGWVESRARVSNDERDMPSRIVGILMDITDRKEAEAALRESSRRKDEFLAILAHELRNPLAPIRYAGRMLKAPITQDRLVNVGDMIERQLAHMTRLLDDLLDTSRVSRGVLELRRGPLDLRAAIEAAIDATRPSVESAGQTLLARISASPLPVDGDRVRLTQAVGNLLDNASKYSDPGTQIEIEARETAEEVIVELRDHGIGMSQELLPKVFELFIQGNHGTARSKGLGIGLALTQQLVALHEGRIEAHSDGPGLGSRFVLSLPRRADLALTQEPPPPAPVPGDARGMRVLIADDNIDGAQALALVLEQSNHLTRVAHDGASALTLAEIFRPQIALLDIGLPDMTGLDLARQIRARPWGVCMRLIAVTGWGQESDRRKSTEAGIDEHLTKPVDPDQLLISIAAYAAESHSAPPPCASSAAASMT
jgi:PAS domain S-box-containing protein